MIISLRNYEIPKLRVQFYRDIFHSDNIPVETPVPKFKRTEKYIKLNPGILLSWLEQVLNQRKSLKTFL